MLFLKMEKKTSALLSTIMVSGSGRVARRDKVCWLRASAVPSPVDANRAP